MNRTVWWVLGVVAVVVGLALWKTRKGSPAAALVAGSNVTPLSLDAMRGSGGIN